MAPGTPVSAQGSGLGSANTLAKIDKLFTCGVGELVELPQIIVVGDQSSGKSSVLEALVKAPLPRDSGLCTRFATQILFSRSAEHSISVSIFPDSNGPAERKDMLRAWAKSVKSLDSKAFTATMKEVHDVMGLPTKKNNAQKQKPNFCNDLLRIEISGPNEEHFSVIDLPGIFRDTTGGRTTKTEMDMVKKMIESYMVNKRSIILAVIPANVDPATQEILGMAKEVDSKHARTLGVLTKPDLVDKGAETAIINLVKSQTGPMKLNWHVLRNPGQKALSEGAEDRDSEESRFFRIEAPWKSLPRDRVGIDALRSRLQDALSSMVQKEFSDVEGEIKTRLMDSQKRLSDMGPERSSPAAQLMHITNIATKFQRLVALALNANHGADSAFDTAKALRLASLARSRMETFTKEMENHGHMYAILPPSGDGGQASATSQTEPDKANKTFNTRKVDDIDRLQPILRPQTAERLPEPSGVKEWLREVHNEHRGFEVGTLNAAALRAAMKQQSSKWANISFGFVSDIIVMVHQFIQTALKCVCPDEYVRDELMRAIFDELIQCYQKATGKITYLMDVESDYVLMTMNGHFHENLQKSRHDNVIASLEKNIFVDPHHGEAVQLKQALKTHAKSGDDYMVQEIHDIVKSYYDVSMRRFVDDVCKQVVVHHLLSADAGPLALITPYFISQLHAADLEKIASEEPSTKKSRANLTKDIESLREAEKVLDEP